MLGYLISFSKTKMTTPLKESDTIKRRGVVSPPPSLLLSTFLIKVSRYYLATYSKLRTYPVLIWEINSQLLANHYCKSMCWQPFGRISLFVSLSKVKSFEVASVVFSYYRLKDSERFSKFSNSFWREKTMVVFRQFKNRFLLGHLYHLLSNAFVFPLLRGVGNYIKVLGYLPISNYTMGLNLPVSTLKNTLFRFQKGLENLVKSVFGTQAWNSQNSSSEQFYFSSFYPQKLNCIKLYQL